MTDRLSKEEVEEVANLISGIIVPKVVRIADKFDYDRDSLIKYVAGVFSTMAEVATFENYIVSVSENPNKCGGLISRQAVLEVVEKAVTKEVARWSIEELPPVENKGEWIYDKGIHNWRCSRCGQTPPPTGYVGMADFMATHFKFCNHCGADMRGE